MKIENHIFTDDFFSEISVVIIIFSLEKNLAKLKNYFIIH